MNPKYDLYFASTMAVLHALSCYSQLCYNDIRLYYVFSDIRIWTMSVRCLYSSNACAIDQSHKSHNASGKYPTMHHFVREMCNVCTFLLQNSALWDTELLPPHPMSISGWRLEGRAAFWLAVHCWLRLLHSPGLVTGVVRSDCLDIN